ncbi:MAG: M28 family peptidase, partial [Actinomycetia bacterium]|nr:M28 family peptidase [Actinomycetes bacterium]
TLDGDQSTKPGARVPRVPEGSAGIERTLVAYLDRSGKPAQDSPFDGSSDYDPFTKSGVPAGGLFAGAGEEKSVQQAEVWGGQAGEPFDPDYHTELDTLDNIDRTALQIHGGGVAYSVGLYAQDQSGRNGMPVREDRTRYRLTDS